MRIILLIALTCFFWLAGCLENKKGGTPPIAGDTLMESLQKKIIGKWGGIDTNQPIISITKDSIYYYDSHKSYSYTIENGNMVINSPAPNWVLKNISVLNDTMFFFDDQPDKIRAYRIR